METFIQRASQTQKTILEYHVKSEDYNNVNDLLLNNRFAVQQLAPRERCNYRSSHPEVFLRKGILKICSKFTGEHPCRSVISIKLLCNFIKIILWHGCSPVNLLHIFRTPFPRNTSGWLLLQLLLLRLGFSQIILIVPFI